MLTLEQIKHNLQVDEMIKNNQDEWEKENAEMEEKRRIFYEQNPDFWSKNMFLMVKAPRQIIAMKYVD